MMAERKKFSLPLRMLTQSPLVRPGRALAALVAIVVAAAISTALLTLYADVQSKLHREFRHYGANIVISAGKGASFAPEWLGRIDRVLGERGVAVPFAYVIATTAEANEVVVAGTDFARVRRLNPWWLVTAWPSRPGEVLMGARAARLLAPEGAPFDLHFRGRRLHALPAGTVTTGADEDSRVYLSLPEFESWTGVGAATGEVAVTGPPEEILRTIEQLSRVLPSAEVRPVRQIVEGEARVLGKTRATLLASVILIVLTVALCVLATLTALVLDRREDFAVMKALGASQRILAGLFAAEAATLGALGGGLGFLLGLGIAAWIEWADFHAAVVPRIEVLPTVLLGSMALALVAALVPLTILRRVQPAAILRGE